MTPPAGLAPRREIVGWAMFDFANQAYTLLIISVVFNELFTTVIVGDRGDEYRLGNLLWSLGLSLSYLIVMVAAPLCGAVMDYTASKKQFLFASYLCTVVATGLLYFVEPGAIVLALVLLVVSNVAYSLGEAFIASFLPGLGPHASLGSISGFGWALGYVGGLFAAGFTLVVLGQVSLENYDRIRWVGPFAGLFFLLAAIPTFVWLRERGTGLRRPAGIGYPRIAWRRVTMTWQELGRFRDLVVFLGSVFFLMAGIYIVIAFAFIYGAQVIGWSESVRNLMFIIVQVTAAAGALGFGLMQHRLGAKRTYLLTLGLWVIAIVAIWATPSLSRMLSGLLGWTVEAQHVFLVVGVLAGLSLGSSQSASRAIVGVLAPPVKAAEFFGFWTLSSRLAAVFGILGLGLLQLWVGLEQAIGLCALLFLLAIVIGLRVDLARGERAGQAWGDRRQASVAGSQEH